MSTCNATVEFWGVEFDVEFDYQPAEPETRTEPVCSEDIDLCSITIENKGNKVDIMELLDQYAIDKICELVWESRNDN